MYQKYTSAKTSINKTKLPASTHLIPWKDYKYTTILDYGGGRYNNLKEYLKENYYINLMIYDPYNRTPKENKEAISKKYNIAICNNVLNVIKEDEIIDNIIKQLNYIINDKVYFYIYEGNKSGIGKKTKDDCYQRNQKTFEYIKFIEQYFSSYIRNGQLIEAMR